MRRRQPLRWFWRRFEHGPVSLRHNSLQCHRFSRTVRPQIRVLKAQRIGYVSDLALRSAYVDEEER